LALALERSHGSLGGHAAQMRASDHQLQQPLAVAQMEKQGNEGTAFGVEGSGYGFKVVRRIGAADASLPTTCQMKRPTS
jgi:branched-chain amino acid transport system substrate-binding protein